MICCTYQKIEILRQNKSMDPYIKISEKQISAQAPQAKSDNLVKSGPKLKSSHFQSYKQFFSSVRDIHIDTLFQSHSRLLTQNKIYYNKDKFSKKLNIWTGASLADGSVLFLIVSFSYFTFEIRVLNLGIQSIFISKHAKVGTGGMGTVYQFLDQSNNKFAIKSMNLVKKYGQKNNKNDWVRTLKISSSIQQYCIAKLCSIFQIGPKLSNQLSFDLIIFENTIQFAMQFCLSLKKLELQKFAEHLKIMHSMHLIHGDLKGTNLMYSTQFSKPVLIDFGLSTVVEQQPGELSLTKYFGTIGYSMGEMQRLFESKSEGHVDLYYNDIFCLFEARERSNISNFSLQSSTKQKKYFEDRKILNHLDNFELIKYIADNNIQRIRKLLKQSLQFDLEDYTKDILKKMCMEGKRNYQEILRDLISNNYLQILEVLNINYTPIPRIQNYCLAHSWQFKWKELEERVTKTGLMSYLFFFYQQDVSLEAKKRKLQLHSQINNMQEINQKYCELVIEYVGNLFSNKQDILETLQSFVSILKKEKKVVLQTNQVQNVYQFVLSLAVQLKRVYRIDLIEKARLQQIKQKKRIQKQITSQLSEIHTSLFNWINNHKPLFPTYENNYTQKKIQQRLNSHFPAQIKNNFITMIFNPSIQISVLQQEPLYENKLLIECMNFQPASKSIPVQQYILVKQSLENNCNSSRHSQREWMQNWSEMAINYCLQPKYLIQFSFYEMIEKTLDSDFTYKELKNKFQILKEFLLSFPAIEGFNSLSYCLSQKLKQFQNFKCLYNISHSKWIQTIKLMKNVYQQILIHFYEIASQCSYSLSLVYNFYSFFSAFQDQLSYSKTNTIFSRLSTNEKWLPQVNQKINLSDYTYFTIKLDFYISYNIFSLQQIHNLIEKSANVFKSNSSSMLINFLFHHHVLKFYLKETETSLMQGNMLINYLRNILDKLKPYQKMCALKKTALIPTIAVFYSINLNNENFSKSFELTIKLLQTFRKLKRNEEFALFLYVYLRNSVRYSLKKQKTSETIKNYLVLIRNQQSKNYQEFVHWHGNLIAIIQIFLQVIYTYDMWQEFKKQIPLMMRLLFYLSPYSSYFLKRRIQNKFYVIYNHLNKSGAISIRSEKKIQFYRLKQFRSPQFPKDSHELNRVSKKRSVQARAEMRKKLDSWELNKKNKVELTSYRLSSITCYIFEFLINQESIEDSVYSSETFNSLPRIFTKYNKN